MDTVQKKNCPALRPDPLFAHQRPAQRVKPRGKFLGPGLPALTISAGLIEPGNMRQQQPRTAISSTAQSRPNTSAPRHATAKTASRARAR